MYRLANAAWGVRRIVASNDFVLQPEQLPRPNTAGDMAGVVQRLYDHARKWAPGFEVPYYVPKVNVSPLVPSPGQYRVDSHGYLFIEVNPEFRGHHAALLTILAHEASHHILDLSAVRGNSRDETEKLTDLAAFICGFEQLVLNGHSYARKVSSGWTKVHLGYLSSEEYRAAQQWVLSVQRLQEEGAVGVVAPSRGLLRRLRRWLGGESDAAMTPPRVEPSTFDPMIHRPKVVLARLGGDRDLLDRLLEFERRRQPGADDLALLDAVAESLERDRR